MIERECKLQRRKAASINLPVCAGHFKSRTSILLRVLASSVAAASRELASAKSSFERAKRSRLRVRGVASSLTSRGEGVRITEIDSCFSFPFRIEQPRLAIAVRTKPLVRYSTDIL